MKKKIIIFNFIIITLSLLATFIFGIKINKNSHLKEAKEKVTEITQILAQNYTDEQIATTSVPDNVRVTIIDSLGKVLTDSSKDVSKEDHLQREEIISALQGKPKTVKRYSKTLKKNMVYYALKVTVTGEHAPYVFVRVAIPVESVNSYVLGTIPPIIYVLIVTLTLSFIASFIATNSLVKPLKEIKSKLAGVNNGVYKEIIPTSSDKEINEMLMEINSISEKLEDNIKCAKQDNEKLNYLLNNITDGIIVLNENGTITVANKIATWLFDVKDCVGKNYSILTLNDNFLEEINNSLKNKTDEIFETEINSKYYNVTVKALENDFTIIVLSDITAVKNGEITRSEFFANASHELKTPLTAIKGFNEIVALKTKDEEVKKLSDKIKKETDRIILLINDMLNLSKLEVLKAPVLENVDLNAVSQDVAESLSSLSKQKHVKVTIEGTANVLMEKEHSIELIKNLVENAIRYNDKNGNVKVSLSENEKQSTLIVSDDGIGIDEENQQRIFERFYRVNKSRSRETGGTGLGLAIVKHICALYRAELSLKSKLGVGTTIKIVFNK